MLANLIMPLILIPTKINTKNDTLIDNIFTNQLDPDSISGNLTVNISDGHLPSFMITHKKNYKHFPKKHNLFTRDLKNFDKENFLLDIAAISWDNLVDPEDANKSLDLMIAEINKLLDKYAPLRKVKKRQSDERKDF